MIIKSIKNILSQNNIKIDTITTDTEAALINAFNANFNGSQRIGCWSQ